MEEKFEEKNRKDSLKKSGKKKSKTSKQTKTKSKLSISMDSLFNAEAYAIELTYEKLIAKD
jgi:hypothetical protein